ncbi:MAG TPA: DUF3089 domain-containing protein [Acidimicrobiia bacterium]|nr:DUF3089 domain-containing protein [Acidimicrobiia bacterium]
MDATVVDGDGTTRRERFTPAKDAAIDCFYVYPTISTDETVNSDLVPGEDQKIFVTRQQVARLGKHCRVFAPVYRQVTLTALARSLGGGTSAGTDARAMAFDDVVDAWKHDMANDNGGRGVVLVGHSQGAGLLNQLVAQEIDPSPDMRARLVSALLLGASVAVPRGTDVGGDFAKVPVCRAARQTGCVISYASFRATSPPPANSYFGRPRSGEGVAACVNPAAPRGGKAPLHSYFPTNGQALPGGDDAAATSPQWAEGVEIDTPFVALPGLVSAECVEDEGFSYLALTVHGDPADPRIDDIGGDLTPEWGMHLVDANVAMGDLVDLVGVQSCAYTTR